MSVTLRGHTFYTASEVSAMAPSGTIDSQWESYDLAISNGATLNWNANKFFVNKITGLVTGWVGMNNMQNMTSLTYGTNANLGIHSDMAIKYPGAFEFGSAKTTASTALMMHYKEINTTISTAGQFTLQGTQTTTANIPYMSNFIETFAYIGSKYGKITTTDIKQPIYLKEGAFYDSNTADLITGKAWLQVQRINAPSGYTSSSYIVWYKNLWSGEIIMQYSLYPTAASAAAITMPSRCAVIGGKNFYTDIRYLTGATETAQARQNSWMRLANTTLSFSCVGCTANSTWMTGSLYYQGEPEVRPQNASQQTVALWVPESNAALPSAVNSVWPSSAASSVREPVVGNGWWNSTYYKSRDGIDTWVVRNMRTGMVWGSFDMTCVTTSHSTSATAPNDDIFTSTWSEAFLPSYRYCKTAGTSQPVYFAGAGYLGTRVDTTTASYNEYNCNIQFYCGTSLGARPANTSTMYYNRLKWGTPGQLKPQSGNLACFTGYYLGNSAGNIVK